jgi:very-short-patch-repair endonuclease
LTDAERVMWNALRAHRLEGAGFKRQVPIGPYIVDFACHDSGLIVEIDGGQHFETQNLKA